MKLSDARVELSSPKLRKLVRDEDTIEVPQNFLFVKKEDYDPSTDTFSRLQYIVIPAGVGDNTVGLVVRDTSDGDGIMFCITEGNEYFRPGSAMLRLGELMVDGEVEVSDIPGAEVLTTVNTFMTDDEARTEAVTTLGDIVGAEEESRGDLEIDLINKMYVMGAYLNGGAE